MSEPRVRMQKCPHCGSKAKIDDSRAVTRLTRDVYYSCTDVVECQHRFVAQVSIIRTLTPSRRPDPRVAIPFGAPRPATVPALPPPPANDGPWVAEVEVAAV